MKAMYSYEYEVVNDRGSIIKTGLTHEQAKKAAATDEGFGLKYGLRIRKYRVQKTKPQD